MKVIICKNYDDMSRRAEAIESQLVAVAHHAQASVPDQPRAEKRGGLGIAITFG